MSVTAAICLAPPLGRRRADPIVNEAVRTARNRATGLREALGDIAEAAALLDEGELDDRFDLAGYVGVTDEMIDTVLKPLNRTSVGGFTGTRPDVPGLALAALPFGRCAALVPG